MPKEYIVQRFFKEEQTEIEKKQNQLNEKEEEIKNLEEEHGGEDGLLSEVATKKEQEETLENILLDIWSDADKSSADQYLTDKDKLQEWENEFKELKENSFLEATKNSKGNITLKAVKNRIAAIEEGEEQGILQSYLDLDQKIKAKSKKLKGRLAKIEKKYKEELQEEKGMVTDDNALLLAAEEEAKYTIGGGSNLSDLKIFMDYVEGQEKVKALKKEIKALEKELDQLAFKQYKKLTEEEIKDICIHDKWLYHIHQSIQSETQNVSQRLTNRVQEVLERYETPLPKLVNDIADWEEKVNKHLQKMGFAV